MNDLGEGGFLSPAMSDVSSRIRVAHAKTFALAEKVNICAHRMLFETEVQTRNIQQILIAGLLQHVLTAYQGVVLLGQHGMPSEAKAVLRTLLEITFRLIAIAKDQEIGRIYVLEDEVRRKKLVNKFKLLSPSLRSEVDDPDLQSLLDSILQNISENQIQERSTVWYAEKAGLEDMYHSAYSYFSSSVHVSVRELTGSIKHDTKGNVTGFRYGPRDSELDEVLLTAMEVMVLSLRGAFSVLPISSHDALESIQIEVARLFATQLSSNDE